MKQDPCCAKLTGAVVRDKAALARLARNEAFHAQKGHNVIGLQKQIVAAKAQIANTQSILDDHLAEHAREFKPDECSDCRDQKVACGR